jgi:hypothetical protein
MSEMEEIDRLVRLARPEKVPTVDVVSQVMARVRHLTPEELSPRVWMLTAGVSLAAAASIVFAVVSFWRLSEPLVGFLYAIEAVLL